MAGSARKRLVEKGEGGSERTKKKIRKRWKLG